MMQSRIATVAIACGLAVAALPAAAAERFEASVTRFHTNPPPKGSTVWVEPPEGAPPTLEQKTNLDAVTGALKEAGFVIADAREGAAFIAVPGYGQQLREAPPKRSPVTIGIGGGSYGRSGGVSLGTSFGIGGKKHGEIATNSLALQLKSAADDKAVWEGRAQSEAYSDGKYGPLSSAIPALARALLADYPGAAGKTVRYKDPK